MYSLRATSEVSIYELFPLLCQKTNQRCWDMDSKLISTVVSTFTAHYIYRWPSHITIPLVEPMPSFDGRAVAYPKLPILRDYLSWRQVDCHINNLYNTTFWALVKKGGMTATEAEKELAGTLARDKNEILFSKFGINYNNEDEMYKKGTVLFRGQTAKGIVETDHADIIKDDFWEIRPWILGRSG